MVMLAARTSKITLHNFSEISFSFNARDACALIISVRAAETLSMARAISSGSLWSMPHGEGEGG